MRLQPTRARFVGAALALAGIGALAMDSGDSAARCTVLSAPGGQAFVLRVASTAAERSVGLSDMERIPHDGLLLEWSQAGRHPIWMADMRFALDLVWLDTHGTVVAALTDVPVCEAAPCEVYEPAGAASSRAVLELPAGAASLVENPRPVDAVRCQESNDICGVVELLHDRPIPLLAIFDPGSTLSV